jgi:hypothetical protein
MQNTLISTPVLSTTNAAGVIAGDVLSMPQTVVQHDTSTVPSIKLSALDVATSITVGNTTSNVSSSTDKVKLAEMELARKSWETTELAASNKRLYAILKDAYGFYLALKQDSNKDARKGRADELDAFIARRGYTFMPSTHDMTRVVKCVFGMDRRRVSAYSIALREALRQEIAGPDLVQFIEENGGVEQIRLGFSKPLSVTKRAAMAAEAVLGTDLGLFKFDPKLMAADADWADKQVVIVATYLPTGEFQVNAVLRHDSAVNSALAAYYSQQQAKLREAAKTEREADEQRVADLKKIAARVKTAVAKIAPQPSKADKQKARVAKEVAAIETLAATKACLNSLLAESIA